MNSFALETAETRADIIYQFATPARIPAYIVEKDFRVCWLLGKIFDTEGLANHAVFKGRPSLLAAACAFSSSIRPRLPHAVFIRGFRISHVANRCVIELNTHAMASVSGFRRFTCFGLVVLICGSAGGASNPLRYNRDIRPIFSENCFACHGTDSAARKAGLRLDRVEDATAPRKDSDPAITPGHPEKSAMVKRINADDPDDIMPPPKSHKKLTSEQKATLRKWITEGAKYEPHWSMVPPVRPVLPLVKNDRWCHNPIDFFILARLEKEGLAPAAEADRRSLARRVTLDLTGLPPTTEELDRFLTDDSPDAYEHLVDRLLASPNWGEHRARYWLDLARYADSNGIHIDNYREIWPYRAWVINAFNKNMPFDEFTIEQLAGDLLPNPTMDQKIATGFNRCNITTSEGGAIDEEYYVLYARDRTEATAQTWLGLTAGCAVCHDHKYDRFSQKEFYSMSAFFNNTTQKAMDGNVKDTPPVMFVPAEKDLPRWQALSKDRNRVKDKLEKRRKAAKPDFEKWVSNDPVRTFTGNLPKDEPVFRAALDDDKATNVTFVIGDKEKTIAVTTNTLWTEGAVGGRAFETTSKYTPEITEAGDRERDQAFSFSTWVRLTDSRDGAIFARMDDQNAFRGWDFWLEGGKPGTHIINKWPESALKVVGTMALESKKWSHVCITYDGSSKASGVAIYVDGKKQAVTVQADTLNGTIKTDVPLKIGQRKTTSPIEKAGLQDVRFYARVLKAEEVEALGPDTRLAWLLKKPADKRTALEAEELFKWWLEAKDSQFTKATARLVALDKEEGEIKSRGGVTHIMQEKTDPAIAFVLYRGEYTQRRDKVTPATPAALPPIPDGLPHNRLGFAKWLVMPEQPLTARVTVNRFWQEVFGTGIVRTSGDLGVSGEQPSNQELLDWLAVEFRESGWDVKKFFKLIVTSSAYRQTARVTSRKLAKDPENRLISRGPRFRMDAEMLRDTALEASGLLVAEIGGPSVKPYQPDGVWEAIAMKESNTGHYVRDNGDKLYRRSLYTFWKRQAPPATMEIFNAPNRESCTVRRERSNTPLQALVTLNDTQFVEAARCLAEAAIHEAPGSEAERIDFMAERLMSRPLNSKERKIAISNLHDFLTHYKTETAEAGRLLAVGERNVDTSIEKPTLAGYTMLANELMNLDEVLNK
jgi:hypothetical protein